MLGCYNSDACSYLRHKHKLSIWSRFSDFVIFSMCFRMQSEGSISQLSNIEGRYKCICS